MTITSRPGWVRASKHSQDSHQLTYYSRLPQSWIIRIFITNDNVHTIHVVDNVTGRTAQLSVVTLSNLEIDKPPTDMEHESFFADKIFRI